MNIFSSAYHHTVQTCYTKFTLPDANYCPIERFSGYCQRKICSLSAEPVQKLVVLDILEKQVHQTAGPYEEGAALYLKCRAYGGMLLVDISHD